MMLASLAPEQTRGRVGAAVRISAGEAKGARLKGPRTKRQARPTSSRVRGAIFNMLARESFEDARVLDAYAGTGALGIEALSRGARWGDFVERDPEMCRRLRENLRSAGFQDRGHVYCATVEKAVAFLPEPYDLVMMDPPYDQGGVAETLDRLAGAGLLKDEALVVVEHAWRLPPPERAGPLALLRRRRYGDTAVSFYRRESGS